MSAIEVIKKTIDEKRLKKCAVAEKIGLTPQQFSDMLNGRRTIKISDIPKLCVALQITPNELFGY